MYCTAAAAAYIYVVTEFQSQSRLGVYTRILYIFTRPLIQELDYIYRNAYIKNMYEIMKNIRDRMQNSETYYTCTGRVQLNRQNGNFDTQKTERDEVVLSVYER